MKRLLRFGDRFKCSRFDRLEGAIGWDAEARLRGQSLGSHVDFTKLKPMRSVGGSIVHAHESTRFEDDEGWTVGKSRMVAHDVKAPDHRETVFEVVWAVMTAESEGHGPGDRYGGGWEVCCRSMDDSNVTVLFHQSGPYESCIAPSDITLVAERMEGAASWVSPSSTEQS